MATDELKRGFPRIPAPLLERLTPRQREVAEELRTGAKLSDIAARLGISVGTVKVHAAAIYVKLEVSSRFELIARWLTP